MRRVSAKLNVSTSNSGSAKAAENQSVEPNNEEPVMHSAQLPTRRIYIYEAFNYNQRTEMCSEIW